MYPGGAWEERGPHLLRTHGVMKGSEAPRGGARWICPQGEDQRPGRAEPESGCPWRADQAQGVITWESLGPCSAFLASLDPIKDLI